MTDLRDAVTIPARQAWLCPDCERIVSIAIQCPHCSNTHLLNLARILHPDAQRSAA